MSGKFREFHKFLSLVKFATKKTSERTRYVAYFAKIHFVNTQYLTIHEIFTTQKMFSFYTVCMYMYVSRSVCMYMYIVCLYVCTCMYVCKYVCMYVHCTCMYAYVCMYVCTVVGEPEGMY